MGKAAHLYYGKVNATGESLLLKMDETVPWVSVSSLRDWRIHGVPYHHLKLTDTGSNQRSMVTLPNKLRTSYPNQNPATNNPFHADKSL